MSEEEKEVIEELKHYINITPYWKQKEYTNTEIDNYIKILLNLIDKLQKEIEELKKDRKDSMQVIYGGRRFGTERMVVRDYISKDKIREKLNQIHNEFSDILLDKTLCLEEQNLNAHRYDAIRNVLEELLKEN